MDDKTYKTRGQSAGILLLAGFFLLFAIIGTVILIKSVIVTGNLLGWILVIVFLGGVYSLSTMLYGYAVVASIVTLSETGINSRRLTGHAIDFKYEDIRVIQRRSLFSNDLAIFTNDAKKTIYIHPLTVDFGELIEKILARCDNVRFVYLAELTKKPEYWQKEPDWTIINSAIRRAEENAKKSA